MNSKTVALLLALAVVVGMSSSALAADKAPAAKDATKGAAKDSTKKDSKAKKDDKAAAKKTDKAAAK